MTPAQMDKTRTASSLGLCG